MSAFRVFGVSREKIYKDLYKNHEKKKGESLDDFDARMKREADSVFWESTSIKPVSDKFDAPQFCEEFIARTDPSMFRLLTIRVNALQGGRNPKTGEPVRKWVTYEKGKQYITDPDVVRSAV